MKGFLKIISIILVLGGLLLSLLDIFYTWAITRRPLLGIEKNRHYDHLIAGDSRTNPLLPPYLEQITGKRTINIGYPAFTLEDTRRIFRYFFENGNSVDTVYLQIDQRFGTATEIKRDWYYKPYLIMHEGLLTPRVPFSLYARNNKNVTPKTVRENLRYIWVREADKTILDTNNIILNYSPFVYNTKQLADHAKMPFLLEDLTSLDAFLKSNGVRKLVLFTAPYSPNWFASQSDTSNYKQKIRAADFSYYDLSKRYLDTAYFKDYVHIKNNRYFEFCRDFNNIVISRGGSEEMGN